MSPGMLADVFLNTRYCEREGAEALGDISFFYREIFDCCSYWAGKEGADHLDVTKTEIFKTRFWALSGMVYVLLLSPSCG